MEFDYTELKELIRIKFISQANFAKALGVSYTTLNYLLNNKSEWTSEKILKTCQLLEQPEDEAVKLFFTVKV